MDFHTYILRCSDGSYYTGHTEDLDARLAQHERGTLPGYTHDRRPVTLAWCEAFATRDEALAAERRIKGWSRAKKEALIAGDWERVSMLARNRQGTSTSLGRTGGGIARAISIVRCALVCHPDTPARAVKGVEVRILRDAGGRWLIEYVVSDPDEQLRIPIREESVRADGLWQTTCLEMFVADPDGGYREFNFAPSTKWAAYRFDGRRIGMRDAEMRMPPDIAPVRTKSTYAQRVALDAEEISPGPGVRIGLCAVIEEIDGTKSWWALKHPPGAADFHDPACFALELPAAR